MALTLAGALCAAPANADFCELTWDTPCPVFQGATSGSTTVVLTICACDALTPTVDFGWIVSGALPAGVTVFPNSGLVTIPAGGCVDIPLTVTCPAGLIGQNVPITVDVSNITAQTQTQCTGSVKPVRRWIVQAASSVVGISAPSGVGVVSEHDVQLVVSNIGSSGKDGVRIDLTGMGAIEPVEPFILVSPLAPGASQVVTTRVRVVPSAADATEGAGGPPRFGDLLLAWDDDGTGLPPVVNSSVKFRVTTACPTDLNGDGITNGADITQILNAFGQICP